MKRCLQFLVACAVFIWLPSDEQHSTYHVQWVAFGTLVDITLVDVSHAVAQQASYAVEQRLNQMHQDWHAWLPSELLAINQACQTGAVVNSPPALIELISLGTDLYQSSQTLFNPAVGELIGLWGFLDNEPLKSRPPPQPDAIQTVLKHQPQMTDIQISGQSIRCTNPHVRLDFGAFAKGYAIDIILSDLQRQGIHHALINSGGDLRTMGENQGRAWQIGIKHPKRSQIFATITNTHNQAIFTSGTQERFFRYQQQDYHHIIDPRSGYPANGFISVTVLHNDATVADAAATALLVAGPDNWQQIAQSMVVDAAIFMDQEEHIYVTPALAEFVTLLQ